jgi:hypothetical protein
MARPRPVPPYLRVVEPSAWLKALKSRACALGVDADAGVADFEAEDGAWVAVSLTRETVTTTSPGR